MRGKAIATGLLAVAVGLPAAAQDPEEATAPSAAAAAPASTVAEPVRALSLSEAIAAGIENNLDVAITRYDPLAAEYDHSAAWGPPRAPVRRRLRPLRHRDPGLERAPGR